MGRNASISLAVSWGVPLNAPSPSPDTVERTGWSPYNSLHATGLYIDHMNNSIAKKEIMKRKKKARNKVTEPG